LRSSIGARLKSLPSSSRRSKAQSRAGATDQFKDSEAIFVANDRFAIDEAGSRRQRSNGPSDEWETPGKVVPVSCDEPDAGALAPRHDAEAVMLDLMNPAGTRRRLFGGARQARLKAGQRTIGAQTAPKLTRY
jgi:hypothetical protein